MARWGDSGEVVGRDWTDECWSRSPPISGCHLANRHPPHFDRCGHCARKRVRWPLRNEVQVAGVEPRWRWPCLAIFGQPGDFNLPHASCSTQHIGHLWPKMAQFENNGPYRPRVTHPKYPEQRTPTFRVQHALSSNGNSRLLSGLAPRVRRPHAPADERKQRQRAQSWSHVGIQTIRPAK